VCAARGEAQGEASGAAQERRALVHLIQGLLGPGIDSKGSFLNAQMVFLLIGKIMKGKVRKYKKMPGELHALDRLDGPCSAEGGGSGGTER
jgi:hypothetical protein